MSKFIFKIIIIGITAILLSLSASALGGASGSVTSWNLSSLYAKYVSEDKDIIARSYSVEAAKARVNQSAASYYPHISIVSNLNANQTFQPNAFQNLPIFTGNAGITNPIYYRFNTGLSLQYTIWNADNRSAAYSKSSYTKDMASLELSKMKDEKLYQLALQYYSLARYRLKLTEASRSLVILDDNVAKLKLKLNSGLILQSDYDAAELKKIELELMIRRYENEIRFIISQLDDFVGGELNYYDTSMIERSAFVFAPTLSLPDADRDSSADYRAALLSSRISDMDELSVSSKLAPTLSLSANYLWEQNDRDLNNIFSNLYQYWSAGVSLDYPIYDGDANGSSLKAARYDSASKKIAAEATVSNIKKEFDGYKKDYALSYDNYILLKKSHELSSKQLALVRLNYDNGRASLSAYIDMILAENRAYGNMLDARVDMENIRMRYFKSAGILEESIFGTQSIKNN